MLAFVGEHGVNFIRHGLDQCLADVDRDALGGPFMHLDEGKLRGSIDRDQQIEPAFFGAHFRDVDVEVADRVGLELLAPRPVAVELRQSGDRKISKLP